MLKLFTEIFSQLAPARRREAGLAVGLSLLGALLNLAGLGGVLGAVALLLDRQGAVAEFWRRFGVDSGRIALVLTLAAVAVLLLLKDGLLYVALRRQTGFIFRTQSEWSARLHRTLLWGEFSAIKSVAVSEHVLQLSRVMRVCDKVLLPLMMIITDGLLVVVLISGSVWFMPKVTAAGVIFLLLVGGGIGKFFARKNRELGREAAEADLAAVTAAGENVAAAAEIKVAGKEAEFSDRYGVRQQLASQISGKLYVLSQLPRMLLETSATWFMGGVLLVLVARGVDTKTIILIFSAIIALLSRLLPAFGRIHFQVATIRQYGELWKNLHAGLTEFPAEKLGNPALNMSFEQSLDVRDVAFEYVSGHPVLNGIDFTLKPGEYLGISGRTGCGKSTLLALLLGLLRPTRGEITCDGQSIFANLAGFRRLVALVPQRPAILAESIRKNVAFAVDDADIDDDRVWAALKTARLADFVAALPGGLDHRLYPEGSDWSGGQIQRLAIARAIYSQRQLMLLDEPTSALDAATEAEFLDMLRALQGKIAVVVVSHRPAVLELCDKVIEL